jgi:hypothetical protein
MVSSSKSTSHTCIKKLPLYIVRHQTRTTIRACLNKRRVCVFAKRIKDRLAQKLPDGGEDDELVITVSHLLCHLQRRDDATVLDIVVVERAQWRVPMTLGWAARRSAPRAYQQGTTPGRCTPDALLICIHVRGHSHNVSNGRYPSAQEFMASQ